MFFIHNLQCSLYNVFYLSLSLSFRKMRSGLHPEWHDIVMYDYMRQE